MSKVSKYTRRRATVQIRCNTNMKVNARTSQWREDPRIVCMYLFEIRWDVSKIREISYRTVFKSTDATSKHCFYFLFQDVEDPQEPNSALPWVSQ